MSITPLGTIAEKLSLRLIKNHFWSIERFLGKKKNQSSKKHFFSHLSCSVIFGPRWSCGWPGRLTAKRSWVRFLISPIFIMSTGHSNLFDVSVLIKRFALAMMPLAIAGLKNIVWVQKGLQSLVWRIFRSKHRELARAGTSSNMIFFSCFGCRISGQLDLNDKWPFKNLRNDHCAWKQ